jgi:acyl-CoA dehydrogenase
LRWVICGPKIAKHAQGKLANGANGKADWFNIKLTTGKFFMERIMPETAAHFARIQTGSDTMMSLPAEAF